MDALRDLGQWENSDSEELLQDDCIVHSLFTNLDEEWEGTQWDKPTQAHPVVDSTHEAPATQTVHEAILNKYNVPPWTLNAAANDHVSPTGHGTLQIKSLSATENNDGDNCHLTHQLGTDNYTTNINICNIPANDMDTYTYDAKLYNGHTTDEDVQHKDGYTQQYIVCLSKTDYHIKLSIINQLRMRSFVVENPIYLHFVYLVAKWLPVKQEKDHPNFHNTHSTVFFYGLQKPCVT